MANVNSPLGLRPIGNGKAGTAPRITPYTRSTTGIIAEGMVVMSLTTGPAADADTTMDPNVLGAVAAPVGASDTTVYVYDDPDQEYIIQGNTAVATPTKWIGAFAPLTNAETYSTTTLQSKATMSTSEITFTRADGDILRIVRLWNAEDNDQDAAYAKWVVKIYDKAHYWGDNTAA